MVMSTPQSKKVEGEREERGRAKSELWAIKAIENRLNNRIGIIESDIKTLYIEMENLNQIVRSLELTLRGLRGDFEALKSIINRGRW